MKISVVMTVYNGEKYLLEQMDSILNQSYLPNEIIISDDCSNDRTMNLLEKYNNNKNIEIKIYKNEKNLGFTKNFEKAIFKSTGDLVFLSDQDDVWYKNKIETIINKFNENPDINLIIHDADLVDANLKKTNITKISQVKSGFKNTDVLITGALSVFKKDLLKYILPFPQDLLGHDGYIHFIAKNLGSRLVINDNLQMLRRHTGNTSDWVASSLKKINQLDVFKSQFLSKRAKNYNDRLVIVDRAMTLIKTLQKENNNFSEIILNKSLVNLKKEREALEKRNSLEGKSFFKKKIIAFELLLKNQYVYFNGIKSFIRDLIR